MHAQGRVFCFSAEAPFLTLKGRVGRVPGCDQSGCDPTRPFLGRKDMKLGNVPIEDKSVPISSAPAPCVGAAPLSRLPSCSPMENVNSPLLLISTEARSRLVPGLPGLARCKPEGEFPLSRLAGRCATCDPMRARVVKNRFQTGMHNLNLITGILLRQKET